MNRCFLVIAFMTPPLLAADPSWTEIGSTFDGWQQNGNWELQDGAFARIKGGGNLTYIARDVPDDFELRFEWKVGEGSNSGIYYGPGQVEYQVLDNDRHPNGKNPRQSAASIYYGFAPSKDVTKPVGEWNTGRIVRKGTVIQHWLNGQQVTSVDYADPKWAADVERLKLRGGKLSDRGTKFWLQDHGDPVWFRQLKLREIPTDETVQADPEFKQMPIPEEELKKEQDRIAAWKKAREKT